MASSESGAALRRDFFLLRLVAGGVGLGCLPGYLAWRGSSAPLDAILAVSLVAPLAAAFLVARLARPDLGYAVAAAGTAGLVLCCLAGLGTSAWPALIWLAAAPLEAYAAGGRRTALAPALVSGVALALLLFLDLSALGSASQAGPGEVATVFLIAGLLGQLAWRIAKGRRTSPVQPISQDGDESWLRESLGELVTWHDRQGDVLRATGAAAALTGRRAPALCGVGLFSQVHIPDRPAYLKALNAAAAGQGPVSVEFRLALGPEEGAASRSLRLLWVEMRARPVPRDRAEAAEAAVVAVIRDASASHQHADELESARAEAVRANDIKGRFLATVSHELRTPLNAIIGFSELLSADHPYVMAEERRREYATIIKDSGTHLLDVVNTLLDMSKIESGNFTMSPEPFSLAALAASCCDLMALKAEQAGVALSREVSDNLPDVVADRRACRQILINLVSNAVKFTPAGGTVRVSLSRDGDRAVLVVSDDGIGIRESDLPRIGDPFFQAGDLHRRPHEGTGLGLSVVRGLVGLHRGTMAVESGPGAGTSVIITLPLEGQVDEKGIRPVAVHTTVRVPARVLERRSA